MAKQPTSSSGWQKVVEDLTSKLAKAEKVAVDASDERRAVVLMATMGDAKAKAKAEKLRATEMSARMDVEDLQRALADAKGKLAAAQDAEKAVALAAQADELSEAIETHRTKTAPRVDAALEALAKALSEVDESAQHIRRLSSSAVSSSAGYRHPRPLMNGALIYHGLRNRFALDSFPGVGNGTSFLDGADRRFRSQASIAVDQMRTAAGVKEPPCADPAAALLAVDDEIANEAAA